MGTQDKGGGIRKRKGWYGFVHGYKDYVKNAPEWTEIEWDKESKCKKESRDKMGKLIQKW